MKIKIIGSGIIAITTAIRAAELGHEASLHFTTLCDGSAKEQLVHHVKNNSTSAAAAAFWMPLSVGTYQRRWAVDTLHRYLSMTSALAPEKGVIVGSVSMLFESAKKAEQAMSDSIWWTRLPATRISTEVARPSKLEKPCEIQGVRLTHEIAAKIPVINMESVSYTHLTLPTKRIV